MRHIIASIAQMLRLPTLCGLCNQYHAGKHGICTQCAAWLTPLGPACRYCALPLPDANFLVCGHCSRKKPDVDTVITAYCFDEPLRTLLHEFKYRKGLYLSTFLTSLMLDALPENYDTDCLIPVPMHPKRLRQRGFNQAAVLTKQLSRRLKLPCDLSYCRKIVNTTSQAGLNAQERATNLRHAFQAKPSSCQHVTLIDDLLTTGSTANELAAVLKRQGVSRVDLWCCARVAF